MWQQTRIVLICWKKLLKWHALMSMVTVEHLHKVFGRFTAVKDATFSIEKGEIVGFLGPNGAGKTTTMKMLTGYLPPTAGTASIAGHDIIDEPLEARRHMGYMPENVPLYDDMRVMQYLEYRARLKGICGKSVRQQVGWVGTIGNVGWAGGGCSPEYRNPEVKGISKKWDMGEWTMPFELCYADFH
jgi:ABC-type glutathione transport system ATPase component